MKRIVFTVIILQIVLSLFAQLDTIRYANGCVFIGDTISKKGTLFMSNGAICKGQIIDGRPDGICTFYSQSGDKRGFKYYGEFKKGEFHGKGRLDRSGKVLICTFVDGIEQQDGIIFYKDGSVYQGEIRNGIPNGKGKKYYQYSHVGLWYLYQEGRFEKGRLIDGYSYNSSRDGNSNSPHYTMRMTHPSMSPNIIIQDGKRQDYAYAESKITKFELQKEYAALMSELKKFPGEKLTKAEIKFSKQISRR